MDLDIRIGQDAARDIFQKIAQPLGSLKLAAPQYAL